MINPQDYPVFYQDVNNKQSSIYPIAILGWDSASKTPLPNAIFISTKPENIDVPYTYNENGIADSWVEENFIDADMKVSSVKHSISIESRNFKISNVSITFSNYSNLSDLLTNFNLTNLENLVALNNPRLTKEILDQGSFSIFFKSIFVKIKWFNSKKFYFIFTG